MYTSFNNFLNKKLIEIEERKEKLWEIYCINEYYNKYDWVYFVSEDIKLNWIYVEIDKKLKKYRNLCILRG